MDPLKETDIEKPYYPALGGPLVIVSIGLLMNVVMLSASLANLWMIFNEQQWPKLAALHPRLPTAIRVEFFGCLILLGFTLLVARDHFGKRRNAPVHLTVYWLLGGAYSLVDYLMVRSIPIVMQRVGDEMILGWTIWGAGCLFFIPYVLFSRRAKGTYVH